MNPSVFLHGWRQVRRHSAGRGQKPLDEQERDNQAATMPTQVYGENGR